ncbi:YlbE-like protein [Scopulibacillus darangshiensis]|uniref:YlbE-like protein n=1 Tax=Scopulibacillus darangshiensis TaxID=442528 RepID=A0A4R2P6G9_9BACL|nr:YlbE-like family protein [Scopulibacillus darangshiensis]TCP30489.1 YlbE-like protein [Scopulibacillus darangshiensis]
MRNDIQYYLDQQSELKYFLRMHPEWYRQLSRAPGDFPNFKQEADDFFGRTFSKKIDRFNERVDFLSMLFDMAAVMGSEEEGKKESKD